MSVARRPTYRRAVPSILRQRRLGLESSTGQSKGGLRHTGCEHRISQPRFASGVLIVASLVCLLTPSGAQTIAEGIAIKIYNDGADDLVVSVYDLNTNPPSIVMLNQQISGFAWVPISISANRAGRGNVRWFARSKDPDFPLCSQRRRQGLRDEDSLKVFAVSQCANTRR
jgi:hypothetical protein